MEHEENIVWGFYMQFISLRTNVLPIQIKHDNSLALSLSTYILFYRKIKNDLYFLLKYEIILKTTNILQLSRFTLIKINFRLYLRASIRRRPLNCSCDDDDGRRN